MRPFNVTYLIPSGTLGASQTDKDIFDADAYLKRVIAETPAGIVRLIKDIAISVTARRANWDLLAGRELLGSGEAVLVANASQLDLNFVPDLNIAVMGGTRLALQVDTDATYANGTLHIRCHDYGQQEFAAAIAEGKTLEDL